MIDLGEIYRENFFARRNSLNWRSSVIANAIKNVFDLKPASKIIDVGCATGDLVRELRIRGHLADGIEGSINAKKYFETDSIFIADLRKPFSEDIRITLSRPYDLCISIEVLEHIEEEYSDILIDNLVSLSDTLLITAAKPGQTGHYHVNCQEKQYWIAKLSKRGYTLSINELYKLVEFFRPFQKKKGLTPLFSNSMVFRKITANE